MTRVVKSKYKVSRRLGTSIWGDEKDAYNKRNYRPGQHGTNTVKASDYGLHLKAKQTLKSHYGRINERQFRNIFRLAQKRKGNTNDIFIELLESRLDIIVYRLKLAPTIFAARQLVSHKHIKVNGKIVNIPSLRVKLGDIIQLKEKSKDIPVIAASIETASEHVPDYLEFDTETLSGKLLRFPFVNDVPYPFQPSVNLVVEFYSK